MKQEYEDSPTISEIMTHAHHTSITVKNLEWSHDCKYHVPYYKHGRQWKCSNSAKIWAWNFWYHTQCVSGWLDNKTKNWKNVGKKLIIFMEFSMEGYPAPLPWKIINIFPTIFPIFVLWSNRPETCFVWYHKFLDQILAELEHIHWRPS